MKTYITFNAGENIWEIEMLDLSIDWHSNCFQGSKKDCELEAENKMNIKSHYFRPKNESIFDY